MTPDRLRELLAALGWSQRGLARLVGRDQSLVRRWCDGERPVPVEVGAWLERMAACVAGMLAADPPPQPTRGPRALACDVRPRTQACDDVRRAVVQAGEDANA